MEMTFCPVAGNESIERKMQYNKRRFIQHQSEMKPGLAEKA